MEKLDVLFIGAVMNYDGEVGSHANYIRHDGRWIAPFQYVYTQRPQLFKSEADACVYRLPNLSISKLVDYLKRRMDLKFHIVWHFDYNREEVERILREGEPRLVVVSSTLAFYPEFLNDCVRWINARKLPETKVVVGGKWIFDRFKALGPSRQLESIFVQCSADYYVINAYGEETLYRLLLAEQAGEPARAQSLPSLAYKTRAIVPGGDPGASTYVGKYYQMNGVIPEIHTPGHPMIDFENVGERFLDEVVHVRAAVSCAFKCRFCTFPVLQGAHEVFDNEAVIAQLRQLKRLGVKALYFIDDTFNVPLRRFEDLMDRMIEADLGMTWVSFFRAQYANREVVQKMYDAGCRLVYCGFESGNDELLKRMNKKVTVEQYVKGLDDLERVGIVVLASYIVGYPGESYRSAMDTLELMNHPTVRFSRGGLFYYETNAPIAEFAKEWGLEGSGAEWSHDTMDSKEAAGIHLEMIDRLENVNIPISDGGGWNNFHLFARGIDFKEQEILFREFNRIQKTQIEAAGESALKTYRAFAQPKTRRRHDGADPTEGLLPSMDF